LGGVCELIVKELSKKEIKYIFENNCAISSQNKSERSPKIIFCVNTWSGQLLGFVVCNDMRFILQKNRVVGPKKKTKAHREINKKQIVVEEEEKA
jgi:hypothetical protein